MNLSELTLTIDTREKDQSRINTISKYFKSRNAHVINSKLDTLDYHIHGFYNNKEVDIGIEYKTGSDFAGNRDELPDRFARSLLEYINVGLIIEHDYNRIVDQETKFTEITLYEYVIDWNTKQTIYDNYQGLHNALRTYEREGILTGEINGLFEFPRMCIAFLNYVTADDHKGICFENGDKRNVLMKIPGIGVNGADKLLLKFGSIHNVFTADEEEIKKCIGNKKGEKFIEYVRSCV